MAFAAPLVASLGSFFGSAAGIATVATTGFSVLNSIQQGNYQAAVARNNAAIAEQNANAQSNAAQKQQMRSDQEYAGMLAEQTAAQAASGVDLLGRTMTAGRRLTEKTGVAQAFDIRTEGASNANKFLQDQANFLAEAKQAKKQAGLNAVGSVISGIKDYGTMTGAFDSLATKKTGKKIVRSFG